MTDLFPAPEVPSENLPAPLADRIRPKQLEDFLGADELIGKEGFLSTLKNSNPAPSLILWGPPGCGKTTLARLLAKVIKCDFETLSAVLAGVKDVRQIVAKARQKLTAGKRTLLFIDEIHRFNKAQQDAFLPHVENGTIILVGATTENPSFEVISALLSRCRVIRLLPLSKEQLEVLVHRALTDSEKGLGEKELSITEGAISLLCELSHGDARTLYNTIELCAASLEKNHEITEELVKRAFQTRMLGHDKAGDSHYNLISAFHKSLRGSDPDAALHYFYRMVEAGDDPLFLIRRMFNFASEDIGNADPQAIVMVQAALSAYNLMGKPEGILPIAQVVIYLATAPKSNSVYMATHKALEDVRNSIATEIPQHLINAPTRLMKEMGFGKTYKYPHDYKFNYVAEEYLPARLAGRKYYQPQEIGFEREIGKRMSFWKKLRNSDHDEPKDQ